MSWWNVFVVTMFQSTWLSFEKLQFFCCMLLSRPPLWINMLHICKTVSLHNTKISKWGGEGSFRLSIIKTPVFLMIFFIYLISCRCTVFQKQIYDVDMMKLISLSIQIFHSFVIFTWCNQHSCWCIISNCTCLTYTLQYQTYIGTCTCK